MLNAAGLRVVAFSHVDDYQRAFVYGHGTYQGLFTWGNTDWSQSRVPTEAEKLDPFRSPRILLDNGYYIWGLECWWIPEADFFANPPSEEVFISIDND